MLPNGKEHPVFRPSAYQGVTEKIRLFCSWRCTMRGHWATVPSCNF